jgi:hypothetical protein
LSNPRKKTGGLRRNLITLILAFSHPGEGNRLAVDRLEINFESETHTPTTVDT